MSRITFRQAVDEPYGRRCSVSLVPECRSVKPLLPRAIAGPIRVSVNRICCLGRKGQVIGRFGLTDCGKVGTSCVLYDVLVPRIYGLTGLSA
jgi:hypothetical protein